MLLGCTGSSETPPPTGSTADQPDAVGESTDPLAPGEARSPGIELPRGHGHEAAITEVWLDPRASAALSLDNRGGVRLWPTLPSATEDVTVLAPVRLPLHDPTSLSLARADEHRLVIAALDTIQAGRVLEIAIDAEGKAWMRERFATPPDDPLLELHVFDGGERLLALGVDHRLTLYDGHGQPLAELAEYGLAPWQLRIAGTAEAPQLAMILVGPTRIQRLSIAGDRITLIGEPHPFVLDRGPNHNDLALLPAGRTAAVFRRPKPRGTQWSLELHDLETGEVRVLWGEVESKLRPRVHIVDEQRVLLEDGSGAGFWIDLGAAVVMPAPFELPEELEKLPPESRVTPRRVTLPESSEGLRRRTSVVAGLRAVPAAEALVLDPLDADHHHRLSEQRVVGMGFALDHDGSQLAFWTANAELGVESLAEGRVQTVAGCPISGARELAFTDPDHVLVLDHDSAAICEWRSGKVVGTVELPTFHEHQIRVGEPGSGQLAIRADEESTQILRLAFADNHLGPLEPVAKAEIADHWPELGDDPKRLALDGKGQRYTLTKVDTREFNITTADGEQRTLAIADDKINIERFMPNADGSRVAIVHEPAQRGYYSYYYEPPSTLSMWAIEGDEATQLWSIPDWHGPIAWSGDGSRLVLEHSPGPGARVITPEGELVAERRGLGLELERLPDEPAGSGK